MESTTGEDEQRPSGRGFLGLYGPPPGKTWAEMTDDEIDALARHMYRSMSERMAEIDDTR